jgi:hypothetical protein
VLCAAEKRDLKNFVGSKPDKKLIFDNFVGLQPDNFLDKAVFIWYNMDIILKGGFL